MPDAEAGNAAELGTAALVCMLLPTQGTRFPIFFLTHQMSMTPLRPMDTPRNKCTNPKPIFGAVPGLVGERRFD